MTKDSKKQDAKPSEIEYKFQLLLTLITLLKSTRHKNKKTELEFLMVNQTFNLVPYSNCVYWELDKNNNPHEAGFLKLDCSKAAQKLKWEPKWNLEFTLNEIIDWNKKFLSEKEDLKFACLNTINRYTTTF